MRLFFSLFFASIMGCLTVVTDSAAFFRESFNGVPVYWAENEISLNIRVGCPPTPLPIWGPCWTDTVVDAANQWLATNTSFRFLIDNPSVEADPCANPDTRRTLAFTSTTCGGLGFGTSLAITYYIFNPATGTLIDADTIFDGSRNWTTYTGPLQFTDTGVALIDFHRVVIHELGHAFGLDHPDDPRSGQVVDAIMNRRISDTDSPRADDFAGIRAIYPIGGAAVGLLENPPAGTTSAVSGIGTISGWVCEAGEILIVVDGTFALPVGYGTPRSDTRDKCGKDNNGFGLLVNWNNLSNGAHQVVAYADGVEFGRATITVSRFDTDFLRGASGTYTVPFNGRNVTLQWQESLQNFVINGIQ